ncbi:MAG: tyrosine-protein phosphatase [Planctomycetes bacterium]|nr:tyrosine-protein phosphatase [Planctomycetota bacterium]
MICEGRAYRSAQPTPETLERVIRDKHVRTMVNLRGENEKELWYQREKTACEKAGVKLVNIRLSASAMPSRENLLALFELFSDPSNEPLLIHCKSGADRSGMAAGLWRMIALKEDAATAMQELSIKYGHFRAFHPQMSRMVEMFRPTREWIEQEYKPDDGPQKDGDD